MGNTENIEVKKRGRPSKSNNIDKGIKETNSFSNEYNSNLTLSQTLGGDVIDLPIDLGLLNEYVKHPMLHNKQLRQVAWWAYRTDGSISSGLDYMRSMHTLDKVVYCKSNTNDTKKCEDNKRKFNAVLDTIKYKKFIRDALLKDFNDGVLFYYFETSKPIFDNKKYLSDLDVLGISEINEIGFNASIIALPVDYCKIIGKKNNTLVGAFDLRYFNTYDDINLAKKLKTFPKEIRDGWERYSKNGTDGSWIKLDETKTIIHKIKSADNDPWGIPLSLAALDDILYANHFITTKRNILNDLNNQIFYETFPEGEKKGSSSLTEKQQAGQHNLVKSALFNQTNKYGKAFFSLAAGTKLDQIKVDTTIFDEKNESNVRNNISQAIGVESSLLGGASKSNYATATLNIENVSSYIHTIIQDIVDELNKVINKNIIKDAKNKATLYILPTTTINRDKMVKNMADLYARGKGSLQAWISATGFDVEAYVALMDEELLGDWENKYVVHKTSFTMSKDSENDVGAPKKDSDNQNTILSKTNGGEISPRANG